MGRTIINPYKPKKADRYSGGVCPKKAAIVDQLMGRPLETPPPAPAAKPTIRRRA